MNRNAIGVSRAAKIHNLTIRCLVLLAGSGALAWSADQNIDGNLNVGTPNPGSPAAPTAGTLSVTGIDAGPLPTLGSYLTTLGGGMVRTTGSVVAYGDVVANRALDSRMYVKSVTYQDGWAQNDYKEICTFNSSVCSGSFRVTLTYARANLTDSSEYRIIKSASGTSIWRECMPVASNPQTGSPANRAFAIDFASTGIGTGAFRVRAIKPSATSGTPGSNVIVNVVIEGLQYQISSWTGLVGVGNDAAVTTYQPSLLEEYLYVGNPGLAGNAARVTTSAGQTLFGSISPLGTERVRINGGGAPGTPTAQDVLIGAGSIVAGGNITGYSFRANNLMVDNASAGSSTVTLNKKIGWDAGIYLKAGGLDRWKILSNSTPETGANSGSSFIIEALDDSGTSIDYPMFIGRSIASPVQLGRSGRSVLIGTGTLLANERLRVTGGITPAFLTSSNIGLLVGNSSLSAWAANFMGGVSIGDGLTGGAGSLYINRATATANDRIFEARHASSGMLLRFEAMSGTLAKLTSSAPIAIINTAADALTVAGGVGVTGAMSAGLPSSLTLNQNATSGWTVTNASAGTAAIAQYRLSNDIGNSVQLALGGSQHGTAKNKGYIYMGHAAPFEIYTNGVLGLSVAADQAVYAPKRMVIGAVSTTANFVDDQSSLQVAGTIRAKKIVVTTTGFPDYVFAADYKLRPLSDVEVFIKNNKHLPGVPNEAQVIREGISVDDMIKRQMEKIEELTLYAIAQDKELAAQRAAAASARRDAVMARANAESAQADARLTRDGMHAMDQRVEALLKRIESLENQDRN